MAAEREGSVHGEDAADGEELEMEIVVEVVENQQVSLSAGEWGVTLSAEEALIEAARERARAERTTLNEEFRKWLADYAQRRRRADAALAVLAELRARVRTGGRRFTREEMHER